jgi:hypothetical protein
MAQRPGSTRGTMVVVLIALATSVPAASFAGAKPSPTAFVSISKASRTLERLAGTKLHRRLADDGMVLTPLDPAHPGRFGWFSVVVHPTRSSARVDRRATWTPNICGLMTDGNDAGSRPGT